VRPVVDLADVVRPVTGLVELGLAVAVAQPGEAVAVVLDVEVVPAQLGQGLDVVQRRAGPQRGHGRVGLVGLVPAAARLGPDRLGHELVLEGDEVVDGRLLGAEAVDVVALVPVDALHHPVGLGLDGRQHGAVADRAVRPQEDQVVWDLGRREPEVRLRLFGPCVLQVHARRSDDGEPRLERRVEARRADEHVDGVFVAVVADAALLRDLFDLAVHDRDVFFGERFEVADAGGEAAAAEGPVWDQLLFEELVRELLLHLLEHVCAGVVLSLGVVEEERELTVETSLDLFAVL